MYFDHWGLREPPFGQTLGADGFFPNPTHEEALARLHFLVDCRRRLGLLSGEAGCGKSTMLEVLAAEMRRQPIEFCRLSLLGLERSELAWGLARGWGCNPDESASEARLWRQINDRLREHHAERLGSVALLDDAGDASSDVINQVLRLAHLPLPEDGQLTIVVVARTSQTPRLDTRILELADLRIDVGPWTASETDGYIHHRLARAGRSAATFTPEALGRLHEISGGVPRHINQTAELSLLAAAGQGLRLVDVQTIDAVCDELSVAAAG